MAVFLQSLDENQNADDGIVISEETRTALAYVDLDLPTATELEVQQLVESVGGTYVNEAEAMIHVRDALIRHTDLKLSDFDVHTDDDSTKLKDAINPTTGTFAEVTFALDGAVPTFTLAGVISTATSVIAEEPAYFALDANTVSIEEPVVEAVEEEITEDIPIEDTAEASADAIDEDNDNGNEEESSNHTGEDTGEAEDTADESEAPSEDSAVAEESAEAAATETEEDTAASEPVATETETTAVAESPEDGHAAEEGPTETAAANSTDKGTVDTNTALTEEDVTAAAAESASESSVVRLIKVEASDEEAAELSAEPADYSVYPAGAGAEIAAATDELALAA